MRPTNGALRLAFPSEAPADKPSEIEIEIGKTVARAAVLVCVALEQYQAGQGTLATNTQGAELIARLHALQTAAPDIDFARAGKWALRRILAHNIGAAEALCRRCSLDQVLGTIVSWPLEVLERITANEQQASL